MASTESRPTGLLIRTAAPPDVAALTAIYRHAVLHGTGTFEIDPPSEDEMAARLRRVLDGGYPWLVAEVTGTLAGYAYAFAYRDRPAFRFTLEDSVYVRADHWGRGVGGRLLAALIGAAEAAGYRQMVALVGDRANEGSIALHVRAGFREIGGFHAAGWKMGRWLDVVLMQRALGEGDRSAPTT